MSSFTIKSTMTSLLMGVSLVLPVRAESEPMSLLSLLERVPPIPTSLESANALVNDAREIPSITAFLADLDLHEATVSRLANAADAKIQERMSGGKSPERAANAAAGAAGIDIQRMQNDPAYAKEMEAKMRAMSPAEMMALSAAMSAAMGMKGTVAIYDPPEVSAAAEAGKALMDPGATMERMEAHLARWAEVDRKVTEINQTYEGRYPKLSLSCDGEGGGRPECVAERERYKAEMLPLLLARDTEVLKLEAATLAKERAALVERVRAADPKLRAAKYGAASAELGNPMSILFLDQVVAEEIRTFATKLDEVTKRAAFVTHCGQTYLTNPGDCYAKK
ncbi:MAG: hypothetical protein IT349_03595 [Candidatus Eisenbacteria bacterium]|nr:hypothetical protein [Candidatus Eisenbacteria bacterium]